MEHVADQSEHVAALLDEVVTLTRADVPISAPTIDRHAAEPERLTRERAALRETLVRFWARIGKTDAQ